MDVRSLGDDLQNLKNTLKEDIKSLDKKLDKNEENMNKRFEKNEEHLNKFMECTMKSINKMSEAILRFEVILAKDYIEKSDLSKLENNINNNLLVINDRFNSEIKEIKDNIKELYNSNNINILNIAKKGIKYLIVAGLTYLYMTVK